MTALRSALLAAVVLAAGAQAQPALDPDLLPHGVTVADMAMAQGDQRRPIGTATTAIGPAVLDGREVLRVVLAQEVPTGTMRDTLDLDPETLRPIRYRNDAGAAQSIRVAYGPGGHVRSELTRGGRTTVLDTTLAEVRYDASLFQSLVAALPLAAGFAADVPLFHYQHGALTYGVRVVGEGTVAVGDAERPVWLVEVTYDPRLPLRAATLAIDRETRRTWRVEGEVGPGVRFEQVTRAD